VLAAIDTIGEITGSPDVNLIGSARRHHRTTCSTTWPHERPPRAQHFLRVTLRISRCVLRSPHSPAGLVAFAAYRSRRKGIITSRQMGSAFTWLRPMTWSSTTGWNNYLMGERPPAFDILAWNADGTNLPGALHGQFLDIFSSQTCSPGRTARLAGHLPAAAEDHVPTFVHRRVTDHLTPWQGCYRDHQLLGGPSTFVLSYSGHIASLVNPPGNPKAHYWYRWHTGADPTVVWPARRDSRAARWEAWADWVTVRSGDRRPAPAELGSERQPGPGPRSRLYVRDMVPTR